MKKKFQVIKNTTNPEFRGLEIDGKLRKFSPNGTFIIDAPDLANDINKTYGRKGNQSVAVVPYNDHETRELGHRYTFSGVDTSHFKVWVLRDGKLARVTKDLARRRMYPIISTARAKPDLSQEVQDARRRRY